MIELNRQIVLFGNFSVFGFDVQNKLKEFISENNLIFDVQQENSNPRIQQSSIPQIVPHPSYCPFFHDVNNSLCVLISKERIHIEQNKQDVDSYESFVTLANTFFNLLFADMENKYKITRIAANGIFSENDESFITNYLGKFLKDNELYKKDSKEYMFRINTNEENKDLKSTVNKIFYVERNSDTTMENKTSPIIYIGYDYNTVISDSAQYTLPDLEKLLKSSKEFRTKTIKRD